MKTTKKALLGATLAIAVFCTFSLSNAKGDNSSSFSVIENNAKAAIAAEGDGDPCAEGKGICIHGSTIKSDHYLKN